MPDDSLVLSLRIHDPLEKKDHSKSTSWVVVQVPREDLKLSPEEFIEKHIKPAALNLRNSAFFDR